jgi:mannose-6-phosphate isomerase-like protein (cupin superfamily)
MYYFINNNNYIDNKYMDNYMNKYYKYKEKYLLLKSNLSKQDSTPKGVQDSTPKGVQDSTPKGVQVAGGNKVFHNNIENLSIKNNYFRKVLFTTKNMQLVVMSLLPDENIPLEIHKEHDQFIKIEKGYGVAIIGNINKKKIILEKGDCIIIPNNTYHEIKNIGNNKLKLYTIYTPPEHDAYRVDKKKPI